MSRKPTAIATNRATTTSALRSTQATKRSSRPTCAAIRAPPSPAPVPMVGDAPAAPPERTREARSTGPGTGRAGPWAGARIGEGGMGSVYFSRTRGNQPVALKVIRREFAQEQDFRARFEHEAQSARRVQGYHIVPVLDHDTSGERPWLATAFVPGLPLDEALATHGPLPLPAVFQLIGCTAQALHSVHEPRQAAELGHRSDALETPALRRRGRLLREV
ncbi:protein kinase [Streptomyces sp. NPDC048357]|uniref:protein kinase domain-containing protein n=1 Tax=Streptomyces sp. NPDC048357 TaxID=3154719 RepID=UPI00343580FF